MPIMQIQEISGRPDNTILNSICTLYKEVFDVMDEDYFYDRINSYSGWLTLLDWEDEVLVGFKIGYALDSLTFYSWLGGVKTSHRRKGIGKELMQHQLKRVRELGYSLIRTKTRNRFREMLLLNIRNGYDVVDCYVDRTGEPKITLEMRL